MDQMPRRTEGESLMGNGSTMFENMPAPNTSRMTPEKQAEAKRISDELKNEATAAEAEAQKNASNVQDAIRQFKEGERREVA